MDDLALHALAERLVAVDGVVAVALGGSRARGTHRPDSDYDIGLYYRGAPDLAALRALAGETELTELGGWGPWVDGGGWLTIDGVRVDWIYRDLDRVRRIWADCQEGRFEIGHQTGHPLGFYSHAYVGEVALSRVLADPSRELTLLRDETRTYPPALASALGHGFWEAGFLLDNAKKGNDPTYVAGCLFRAIGAICHAVHGRDGRWLINEKGMIASAASLPSAPEGFGEQAHGLLGSVGTTPAELADTIARARALLAATEAAER
ncbi:nucleotidyltransferase domain-containing protein [Tenggerimyces flavus]|uniref:Nucleotidyltransferase domain-containing protein n=1 Tax=Tenggerimyces flavus TaxID=1708749 RepID=A0ABV7YQZ8_9ACTN|nr:nucleotidyltransferase domain-containing protein [Tenggerimyces flavus]MBM7784670.1 putative nucleotidyltransferase [Tenggerimyces flavus]